MATIVFNAPENLASHLNVALSDGRFARIENGVREYADDVAYLLKKSTNPAIRRYIASQVLTIQMDDAEGMKSVLMGSQATPFAPLSASDLGFIGSTGISTAGMGRPTVPGLSTPSPGQVITPTRTPGVDHQQLSPEQLSGLGNQQPITPDAVNQQPPAAPTEESLNIAALNASASFQNTTAGSNVGEVAGDGVFDSRPSATESAPSLDAFPADSPEPEGPPPLSSLAQPNQPVSPASASAPKATTKRKSTRKTTVKKTK